METAAGAPIAVRAWWQQGERTGYGFIYSKEQLAALNRSAASTEPAPIAPAADADAAGEPIAEGPLNGPDVVNGPGVPAEEAELQVAQAEPPPAPAPAPESRQETTRETLPQTASPLALLEGPRAVEFVNEALGFRYSQTVNIKQGQMTNVKIAVPSGRLSINAVPWAEVLIDGTAAGETPLANLSLPIGAHEITFRHPQFGERREKAIVRTDASTRVAVTMK